MLTLTPFQILTLPLLSIIVKVAYTNIEINNTLYDYKSCFKYLILLTLVLRASYRYVAQNSVVSLRVPSFVVKYDDTLL